MASSATTGSGTDASSFPPSVETKPLWNYVTKHDKSSGAGGNISWTCNYCSKTFKSTYTRLRAHLLKIKGAGISLCLKVEVDDYVEMKKLDEAEKQRQVASGPKFVPLPPSSGPPPYNMMGSFSQFTGGSKKRTQIGASGSTSGSTPLDNPITKAFNISERRHLDALIARTFYSHGLPFSLARNPYWIESFVYACSHNLAGYVPPGVNLVSNRLLEEEKINVHRLLAPIRVMWNEKRVSIVSDGWSDSQRRPLINFIAITDGQPIFLKVVDCSGETKDKQFIATLLTNVIDSIGSEKVVQVITDNAPNCKGAGQLIEGQFPNIVWTPCIVHTLNLALKNICAPKCVESNMVTYEACSWITIIGGDAIMIKNFIMNHSMRLSMYNEFVHLKLLSIAETKFASLIVMFRRFKLIKTGLQAMVISEKWALYKEDDAGKAKFVKEKV